MNILRRAEQLLTLTEKLLRAPKYDDAMEQMVNFNKQKTTKAISWMYLSLYNKIQIWKMTGMKTFKLSPELVSAFNNTDVNLKITPGDFKYPFDCFMIESNVPLFYCDLNFAKLPAYNILFVNKNVADGLSVSIDMNGKERDIEWDVSIMAITSGFSVIFDGERLDSGLDYIWLNVKNDQTIKNAQTMKSEISSILNNPVSNGDTQNLVNMFCNTIMYVNDSTRVRADTERVCGRKVKSIKGEAKAGGASSEYIYLTPPRGYVSVEPDKKRFIDKRFIVRGHWTEQAYGIKHSLRRRQWILPYWKGPEMSEVVSKKYMVE